MATPTWNYTTYLNIAFLLIAAVLALRFLRTGGREMMQMMGGGPDDMAGHEHAGHQDTGNEQRPSHNHGVHHPANGRRE
jgi:hypothetical protein